ncbi:hypothetical protein [Sphingomonas sp. BK069]|uniref:hypothetical protein n=1 Tax=Sphingomonas sp. BK069 TaxID=2586979 RepID=UPI001616B7AC|nr:hypothetical protein [Sphingomonas sp. BK069]MBB3349697.1 hypothetical protein [Sphingomonas sp. BK069]
MTGGLLILAFSMGAAVAQTPLTPADARYWLQNSRKPSADPKRLTRIAQAFAGAPLPDGWVPNRPISPPAQLWDFDDDGRLELYSIGQSAGGGNKHALLVTEQQADGSWTSAKVADTSESTLIRLAIVAPGKYLTSCNNCPVTDRATVLLDRTGLEYKSGYTWRYFVPAKGGLVEVTGKR